MLIYLCTIESVIGRSCKEDQAHNLTISANNGFGPHNTCNAGPPDVVPIVSRQIGTAESLQIIDINTCPAPRVFSAVDITVSRPVNNSRYQIKGTST